MTNTSRQIAQRDPMTTPTSTSELTQDIVNKVSANVNSSIATLIVSLLGDKLWATREGQLFTQERSIGWRA